MIKDLCIIAFIFTGAAALPFIARNLRVPSASAEIVFGFIAFNFIVKEPPQWFYVFKELGLIYLMFLAGMELELKDVRHKGHLCLYVLVSILAFIINPILVNMAGMHFYTGIAGGVMSAGVVVPVLKEMKLLEKDLGRAIVLMALTGEVMSIGVLTLLDIYHKSGFTILALWDILRLFFMFALSALFLRGLYYFSWWYSEKVERVMESEDPVEEGLRAIVAIVFTGAMIAYLSGIEPILGSFITGAIFSYVYRSKGVFHEKINGLGFGFFIPLFFIGVGAELKPTLFGSAEILKEAFIIFFLPVIGHLPLLILGRKSGLSLKESVLGTFVLSSPLTMMVVAGTLGFKMGFINYGTKTSIVLAAVAGSIVYPFFFRVLADRWVVEQ